MPTYQNPFDMPLEEAMNIDTRQPQGYGYSQMSPMALPQYIQQMQAAEAQRQAQAQPSLVASMAPKLAGQGLKYGIQSMLGGGSGAAATGMGPTMAAASPYASLGTQTLLSGSPEVIAAGQGLGGGAAATGTGAATGGLASASAAAVPVAGAILGMYQANRARKAFNNGNAKVAGIAGTIAGGMGVGLPMALATYLNKKFWDTDKWKTEGNRLKKLQEAGINISPDLIASMPKKGRSKGELINKALAADYVGNDPTHGWVNNKFAESRDVADLRPEDIQGYAMLSEKFGNDYANSNLEKKLAASKMLLDAGAVREHHGTIDANSNYNADLEKKIKEYLKPTEDKNKKK